MEKKIAFVAFVEPEVAEKFDELAKKEQRSRTNYLSIVIKEFVKRKRG